MPEPIYSATQMPASAYGWSPLVAYSDQRWRLIVAPRPELYDFWLDSLLRSAREFDPQFNSEIDQAWRQMLQPGIEYMRSRY